MIAYMTHAFDEIIGLTLVTQEAFYDNYWKEKAMDELNVIMLVRFLTEGSITKRMNSDQLVTRLATFLLNLMNGNPFDCSNLNLLFRIAYKGDSAFLLCCEDEVMKTVEFLLCPFLLTLVVHFPHYSWNCFVYVRLFE